VTQEQKHKQWWEKCKSLTITITPEQRRIIQRRDATTEPTPPPTPQSSQQLCEEAHTTPELINAFVQRCFPGTPPTVFDYKVVAGVINLFCNLPGSHAATSIVKTIRGNAKAPVCLKQPEAGMIAGMKRYTHQHLMAIAYLVEQMLRQIDVTERDELRSATEEDWQQGKHNAPDWIDSKLVDKERGRKIALAFVECGKVHGLVEPEPERKIKPKAPKPSEYYKKLKSILSDDMIDRAAAEAGDIWRMQS